MTKKQAEFYVAIIVLCIIVATAILLVDFSIKNAILQESNKLRLTIEGEQIGRVTAAANESGAANKPADNPPYPSDILVDESARMEAGSSPNGTKAPGTNPRQRRAKPRGQASS